MFGQQQPSPFGGGFGQQANTTPAFGSPAPAPGGLFGSPAPAAFGQPAFGQAPAAPATFGGFGAPPPAAAPTGGLFGAPAPAPTGFGATGGFGAPAPSTGLFGAPAPAPTGFGGFGAPAPAPSLFGAPAAPAPGLFGAPAPAPTGFGTGGFGSPAPASGLFGSPAPAPSAFGAPAPSAFGAPAPAPVGFGGTTSLFGAPAPAPSAFGGFGAPAPSAFGAPAPTAFGSPAPAFGAAPATGFGAPAPATGFGAPAPAAGFGAPTGGLFGSPPAPSAFGTPAAAPVGGGLFGGAAAAPNPGVAAGGTRAVPFQVTSRADGTATINLQSIAAMQQYQEQSHEELRFADYSQGNRGTAAPAPAVGGFGSPAPAPGLFGAPAPTGAFGSTTPGLFGAPAPAPAFGAAPAPAFGAAPAGGGLFGQSPAPSAFGAAPGSTFGSLGGGFGAPAAPAPLFGAPAPAFGAAPAPSTGLFGSTAAPATTGLFGAAAPATGGFGTGLFGASPAPTAFGAPAPFGAPPAPGLFGQPPAGGGLFGAAPAPSAFGQSAFGQAPTAFGAAPAPGLFGAPAPSMFGAPAPAPGAMFGQPAAPAQAPLPPLQPMAYPYQPQPLFAPNVQIVAQGVTEVMEQQMRALDNQLNELRKSDVWNGSKTSPSPASTPTGTHGADSFFPQVSRASGSMFSPNRTATVIRPRGFAKSEPPRPLVAMPRRDNGGLLSPEAFVRSSQKDLVPRHDVLPGSRKLRLQLESQASPNPLESGDTVDAPPVESPAQHTAVNGQTTTPTATQERAIVEVDEPSTTNDPGRDYYQQIIGNDVGSSRPPTPKENGTRNGKKATYMPKLTKSGYEVFPSLETMSNMTEADLATVNKFSVHRRGYGTVEWDGSVDVRGADLDSIVEIDVKDVSVYAKEDEDGTKPDIGTKLNRPAVITFYGVYPKEGSGASDEIKKRFARTVKKSTEKLDAEFIEYDETTGVWKIRVKHFSRYALIEDDSDDDMEVRVTAEPAVIMPKQQQQPPHAKKSKISTTVSEDYDMSEASEDVDYGKATIPDQIARDDAEEAAMSLASMLNRPAASSFQPEKPVEKERVWFEQGEALFEDPRTTSEQQIEEQEYAAALSKGSFVSNRFMKRTTARCTGSSATSRMRRSVRVSWLPDGSFLSLQHSSSSAAPMIVKSFPVLSKKQIDNGHELLEKQIEGVRVHTSGKDKCPLFALAGDCGLLASAVPGNEDLRHAFLLLSRLFPLNRGPSMLDSDCFPLESRRLAAAFILLFDLCAPDVEKEVAALRNTTKRTKAECLSVVFAALVCGNLDLACSLALEANFWLLAEMLASGPDQQGDVERLLLKVAKSRDLSSLSSGTASRSIQTIIGDFKNEEGNKSIDWRHRLLNRLICDPNASFLQSLVRYEDGAAAGTLPFPTPPYAKTMRHGTKSIFFRLLKMCADPRSLSVCEAINPDGYTTFFHDFSLAFHLASGLVVASNEENRCFRLSVLEAERITDGFATQLLLQGDWEWAVFVSLCMVSDGSRDKQLWKTIRAKNIVLRHYNGAGQKSLQRREFLEKKVGIPTRWFEEALMYRAAVDGKLLDCIQQACQLDFDFGADAFVELSLPLIVFEGTSDFVIACLARFAKNSPPDSLLQSLYKYFTLEQHVSHITSHRGNLVDSEEYAHLVETFDKVQQVLMKLNDMLSARGSSSLLAYPESLLFPVPARRHVEVTTLISAVVERSKALKIQVEAMSRNLSTA